MRGEHLLYSCVQYIWSNKKELDAWHNLGLKGVKDRSNFNIQLYQMGGYGYILHVQHA